MLTQEILVSLRMMSWVAGAALLSTGCGGSGTDGGAGGGTTGQGGAGGSAATGGSGADTGTGGVGGSGGNATGGGGGQPTCGNGVVDKPEQCDGTNLSGATCASLGAVYGGTLACTSECAFDLSDCVFGPTCGDGVAQGPEQCDGADLGVVVDCTSLGFASGTITCGSGCTYDVSKCEGGTPLCSNGVIDPAAGEACDGTDLGDATCATFGFTGGTLSCTASCSFDVSLCTGGGPPVCGDGVVALSEDCDGDLGPYSCAYFDAFNVGTYGCDPVSCTWDTSKCAHITGSGSPAFDSLAVAFCSAYEDCSAEWGRQAENMTSCVEAVSTFGRYLISFGVGFSEEGFAACADSATSLSCQDLHTHGLNATPECKAVLKLLDLELLQPKELGEECRFTGCVEGAMCALVTTEGPGCNKCTDPALIPCTEDYDCDHGYSFLCDPSGFCAPRKEGSPCHPSGECGTANLTCVNSICVDTTPAPAERDEPCDPNTPCKGALECRGGICTDAPTLGEPCDEMCLMPAGCIENVCRPALDWLVIPSLGIGDVCADAQCKWSCSTVFGECGVGFCDRYGDEPTYTCRDFALGTPCEDSSTCHPTDAVCAWNDDTQRDECMPAGDLNQPCRRDGSCDENYVCHWGGSVGKCVPYAQQGEPCDVQCHPSLTCDSSTSLCEPFAAAGEPCSSRLCAEGLACHYDSRETPPYFCAPPLGVGGTCYAEGEDPPGVPYTVVAPCDHSAGTICDWAKPRLDGSQQCTSLPGLGEPCPVYPCMPSLRCENLGGTYICVEDDLADGEACMFVRQCLSNYCYGACVGGDYDGLPCTDTSECTGGYCDGLCGPWDEAWSACLPG